MVIALFLAAALAWWLHKRGELTPNLIRFAGTGVFGFIAIRQFAVSHFGIAALAAAAAYIWWRVHAPKPTRTITDEASALALLRIAPGASIDTIQQAWRTRMQEVHPDAGGSDAAARAVTEARDLLIARQRK